MTAHGYFRHYLYKMKKIKSGKCLYCIDKDDNVTHAVSECQRWATTRRKTESELGETLTPNTIVGSMLKMETNWKSITEFMKEVLIKKYAADQDM